MKHWCLNPLDCIVHADDCRRMALTTLRRDHRIMLTHMAETWERIAADIEQRMPQPCPPFA
jgi:hypothetical protein